MIGPLRSRRTLLKLSLQIDHLRPLLQLINIDTGLIPLK